MPFTLNGIGTHYYGSSNRSAHVGVCKACGKQATLSSYDTRECFCVVFIPLIPLAKYRILDQCSRCRRHHRMKWSDFEASMNREVAPLRDAIKRSPRDPQPYVELIRTYIGWKMRAEAQKEIEAALGVFPQSAEILILSAELAIERNDFDTAVAMYQRARSAEPQNGTATYGYAWVLHQLGRYNEAIPLLQEAIAQNVNNKTGALYLLGISHMKLSHWNDALNAFQQLLSLEPKFMGDKKLLRLVRECKEKLGYQLTEAERRAGRNWWPFGRKQKRVKVASAPTLVRPGLRYAGYALLVVAVVAFAVYGWDRKTNLHVYFDNGLDRTVHLSVDGNQFDLGHGATRNEEMHEGKHTVIVREHDGRELERLSFSLEEPGIFDAFLHDHFFVYNVASARVYRRAVHGYAVNRNNASYSDELIAMKRFFEQRDVDYPFSTPPDTIEMNSASSVEHKTSFNVANELTLSKFAVVRFREGHTKEAKSAIDQAAKNTPCDTPTRRTQAYLVSTTESPAAAAAVAREWMRDCSDNDLEAHRMYQDMSNEANRKDEVRAEYAKLVAASPQSAKLHYLYGRVLDDPSGAATEYEKAMQLDPKLVWPRVALAHAYALMDRTADALREYAAAMDMEGRDPAVVTYYATAAIANGTPESAIEKVDQARKAHANQFAPLDARWLLAVASGDWTTAAKLQDSLAQIEGEEAAWWRTTKLMRIKGDDQLDQRIDVALKMRNLHDVALNARAEHYIEQGEFAKCTTFVAQHANEIDPVSAALLDAYAAGGLMLKGERDRAAEVLTEAEKFLDKAEKKRDAHVVGAVIAGLRGDISADEIVNFAKANDAAQHGWFVAAVRAHVAHDRAHEKERVAHFLQASADLDFPYGLAAAMQKAD